MVLDAFEGLPVKPPLYNPCGSGLRSLGLGSPAKGGGRHEDDALSLHLSRKSEQL